ncbi:MAG: phospholipid carrier-dependent glycosyltransferase [Clostridia bacterium]
MKKTSSFLCLLFILCCLLPMLVFAEAENNNLLDNGGFEMLDSAGDAVDWYPLAYRNQEGYSRMTVSSERAHSGQYSALIENASLNDARLICTVHVEPETLYRLSGYVWVESMGEDGNGANLAIEDVYAFSDRLYTGDGDWQFIEWFGETGEQQTELPLAVRIGGYGSESIGKAYFDDIVLEKIAELPTGVTASVWYNAPSQASEAVEEVNGNTAAQKNILWFVLCAFAFLLLYAFSRPLLVKQSNRIIPYLFGMLLLIALAVRLFLGYQVSGYEVDINCFLAWSTRMAQKGPMGFYSPATYFCDYPPGGMLLLWPAGLMLDAAGFENSSLSILIVKFMPILCDLLGAIVLFAFAKKRISNTSALIIATLYALNPAVLVNGAAWGQMDSALALLLMLTTLFAMEKKWHFALPMFIVSALVKPQALLFTPVGGIWLLMCLCSKQTKSERHAQWKHMGIGLGASVLAALAIVVPFSLNPELDSGWLFKLYSDTLSSYAYTTLNTANLYYLISDNRSTWTSLTAQIPLLLPAMTAAFSAAIAAALLIRQKIRKQAVTIQNKQVQLSLLSGLFALVQVVLCFIPADYSVYGYAMMGYLFAFALLCMLKDQRAEHLPFYMALVLIGIYVLGIKMHERYLFPALLLLLLAYITTKDRRMLVLCVGFSITTFINTAIVLNNSIVLGREFGHMNLDTLGLNIVLCISNLLLCAYAGWIGAFGIRKEKALEVPAQAGERSTDIPPSYQQMLLSPKNARLSLRYQDWLIMGITTLLYAVLAFSHLGSTAAPQPGWVSTSAEEQVVFDLGHSQTFSVQYYAGVSYNDFSISVSEDGVHWSQNHPCRMEQGLCYRWNYAVKAETVDGQTEYPKYVNADEILWLTGKYLRLNAEEAGLNLFEIVARGKDGTNLPLTLLEHTGANNQMLSEAKPVEDLINESFTCVGEPSWYNGTYFDEIYHARTAYEHLHGIAPYETTHPPLGKLIMSLGIALFGMTPFGWRFAGAFIGVLMLPALYLLALQLTKKRSLATVAMLAFTFDLMHFTQTRIATIDSFPVFFIIVSFWFMTRYMQTDVFAIPKDEKPRLWNQTFWKSLIPLALCGIMMGLSIASKWIGFYSAAGLAVLFFVAIFRQYRASNAAYSLELNEEAVAALNEEQRKRLQGAQEFTLKRILITCGFCVLFFVLVPAAIYYLSYIPYLSPTGPVSIKRIVAAQESMLSYHSTPGLGMDHPFHSPWWQWPLILKPMWFAQDDFEPAGFASTIMCMGNPWVFYVGAVCMIGVLLAFILKYVSVKNGLSLRRGNGDMTLPVIVIGFLAQYLPWVLVPRGMYIYHYFASLPFIILATVWMLNLLPQSKRKLRLGIMVAYVGMSILFFILFFPYASGTLTSTQWLDAMKWFPKIYY